MNGAYLGCLAGYNMAAIHLTFELEAVWRSILENFRPVGVWAFEPHQFSLSPRRDAVQAMAAGRRGVCRALPAAR